jgi:hypothetical protein
MNSMTLEQIRKGIIVSAISTILSGLAFAYFFVAARNMPQTDVNTDTGTGSEINKDENADVDVLVEKTAENFFQYKPIFERALNNLSEKKTVEFYESKINEPKIRYFYKNDYRNKRFSVSADYNIEDFASIEELKKKLDVVKQVYVDGVFYVADTEGLSTFSESEDKKFENSTIHLEDLKANFDKYLELYEAENGTVSLLELPKALPEDMPKNRFGFQSQTLGDASIIVDEEFNIWEMSVDYKGTYTTFVFESYDADLNIVPLEEGVDLNLNPSPSPEPSPSVTPEVSPSVTPGPTSMEPTPVVSPNSNEVKGLTDSVDTNEKSVITSNFRLSGSCGKNEGSCYMEYSKDTVDKKILIDICSTDCETRKTIMSLQNDQYQYIVQGWKAENGYTKLYRFDRTTENLKVIETLDQNIIDKFDITQVETKVRAQLASYTTGCFEVSTAGLYCIGNLNQMSEDDVQKVEDYVNNNAKFYKTYIEPFQN